MRSLAMDGVIWPGTATGPLPILPAPEIAKPKVRETTIALQSRLVDGVAVRRPVKAPNVADALGIPRMYPLANPAGNFGQAAQELAPKSSVEIPATTWQTPRIAFGLVAGAMIVGAGLRFEYAQLHPMHNARATRHGASAAIQSQARPLSAFASGATADTANLVATQSQQLQQLLNTFASANGPFNIVVRDLKTGATASYNGNQSYASASLYKLFVAQRILQKADTGELSLSQDAGNGSGRNIADCLTIMINISDNTCGVALGNILNWGVQDAALHTAGYTNTTLGDDNNPQLTSANDVATFLTRLYQGTLLSPNSSARLLGLLKDQQVNNRLPVGLPSGTVIAHKTGDLDGVVHDAGIVYGPKTDYVVSVMSGPWPSPADAPAKFGDLSAKLYNFFEQ